MIGSLFGIAGVSEFIARFTAVIAGIGLLYGVWVYTKKHYSDHGAAYASVLLTLASPMIIDRMSIVNVDVYLALAWVWYLASENKTGKIIATIIGVWSKSLLGFAPLLCDVVVSLWTSELNREKIKTWILAIILPSTWYVIMFVRHGSAFVQSHFFDHLLARVQKPIELHMGSKWFYIRELWEEHHIALIIAGIGLVWLFVRMVQKKAHPQAMMVTLLTGGYLGLLTISKAKLHWYITPLIPLSAILTVHVLSQISIMRIRNGAYMSVALVSLGYFASMTYMQSFAPSIPVEVALARCRADVAPFSRVAYLVSAQSRQDAHTLEAAQLLIGSSLIYGGVPSFRFYVDTPVSYFYQEDAFYMAISGQMSTIDFDAMVMHRDDVARVGDRMQAALMREAKVMTQCERGSWVLYSPVKTTLQK
jgi:hypothetical protein